MLCVLAAGVDASEGVEWTSQGEGEFTLAQIEKPTRGTQIILKLREDEKEFADDWRLRSIITKYSDHISIPVQMFKDKYQNKIRLKKVAKNPAVPALGIHQQSDCTVDT